MSNIPIRRSQVITPFGPGAIAVSKDGVSMLMGGLDKWYISNGTGEKSKHLSEFEVEEKRLKKILNVESLRLPPDYRPGYKGDKNTPNQDLQLPMLRFPRWHYCQYCKKLKRLQYTEKKPAKCNCERNGEMIQVPFIVACNKGHIHDFPWNEWVHKSVNPKCNGDLRLISVGGTTLSTLNVKCTKCGKHRNLMGVNSKESEEMTFLTKNLDSNENYLCKGWKPWFGEEEGVESCGQPLIAALKSGSNIYFPETLSAIYLPGKRSEKLESILHYFESPINKKQLKIISRIPNEDERLESVKEMFSPELDEYEDTSILQALRIHFSETSQKDQEDIELNGIEESIRLEEHGALISPKDTDELKIIQEWTNNGENIGVKPYLSVINLVTKLRETKVLYGFSRLEAPQSGISWEKLKRGREQLFQFPHHPENNWLPANTVFGEGIYIELNRNMLDLWESNNHIMLKRFNRLKKRHQGLASQKLVREVELSPRYVLIHTLAHMLINELVFECGYSATSIRERLYVSNTKEHNMNGFMIYTSSGDSEGTLGGLVRMGKSDTIFRILERAIQKSSWCSSDPICSDIGNGSGQGHHHLNMSACHNCSYLPETSCEEFNMLLDRGLLTGTPDQPDIGFFHI